MKVHDFEPYLAESDDRAGHDQVANDTDQER